MQVSLQTDSGVRVIREKPSVDSEGSLHVTARFHVYPNCPQQVFHGKQTTQILLAKFWRKIESQLREFYRDFGVQILSPDPFQHMLVVRCDIFRFQFVENILAKMRKHRSDIFSLQVTRRRNRVVQGFTRHKSRNASLYEFVPARSLSQPAILRSCQQQCACRAHRSPPMFRLPRFGRAFIALVKYFARSLLALPAKEPNHQSLSSAHEIEQPFRCQSISR